MRFWCELSDACGGYIDQAAGTIQSPSFPDLYPPNKNCVWQIVAPDQYRITLNFSHFDMEGNNVSNKGSLFVMDMSICLSWTCLFVCVYQHMYNWIIDGLLD